MADDIGPEHAIKGIHHITIVAESARRTADYYVKTLGMGFVKKTVNFDRPSTYHLYFGDRTGTPGTLVTFFEWPDAAPGRIGAGTTHHLALTVDSLDALLKWKTWLQHRHHVVAGPHDNGVYQTLIFTDPDGVILELTTAGPGIGSGATASGNPGLLAETWPEPVTQITSDMQILGIHHIAPISTDMGRTSAFYEGLLGMSCVLKTDAHEAPYHDRSFFSTGRGEPGTLLVYEAPNPYEPVAHGYIGHGVTHHFALDVPTNEAQEFWRDRLLEAGLEVTPVLDRKYFHSIYFQDPDGHILEIATTQPGFLVDQSEDQLGKELALPDWLEGQREKIERDLEPIEIE
jgi:glyoxalase family protein